MVKRRIMVPVEDIDLNSVKYEHEEITAPHVTGLVLKLFVWILELPLLGSLILAVIKKQNKLTQLLRNTVIPEAPMFRPEFPPQEPEPGVLFMEEESTSLVRLESALKCLPPYDPAHHRRVNSAPFLYWKIRDFAHAYRSRVVTPSMVAENVISGVEEFNKRNPPMPLLISFSAKEVRKQAAASTQRFEEGNPLSILDGIVMAIKDDIDCSPYPSKGGTTWFHEVRTVKGDAVSVSRLRSCGVILIGKANMHEMGLGTTGNNPNHGTSRNPHALERYTGGSSSGPAALVASGLCCATLGTDGGGSVRIPSSLCGVVGLKTTFGRTDMKGALCDSGTVEIIGPIAASVEDVMLVYSVISGSSPTDRISLMPVEEVGIQIPKKRKGPMDAFVAPIDVDFRPRAPTSSENKNALENIHVYIADFFYENNISFNCARSDSYSKMMQAIVQYNDPSRTVFLKSIDGSAHIHDVELIYKMLKDVIKEVGEKNVIQICTDNASNYVLAGD
ncbi:hypothetical protein GIB67_003263 [Kingdonia uniflora]|uniref:Fatty acid amide hydrolase n=1 Tax=Kingdonia uniflora TaxID=39325 RepID=A0A7J7LXN2_9MAGN|nr:hypothetical protein GIB67_003263 [Kingdonia uniflora]